MERFVLISCLIYGCLSYRLPDPASTCATVKSASDAKQFEDCLFSEAWQSPVVTEFSETTVQCSQCVAGMTSYRAMTQRGSQQQVLMNQLMGEVLGNDKQMGQYMPQMIGLMYNGIPALRICGLLEMCPRVEEPAMPEMPHLLGGDECVSSPKVVCRDLKTAKSCGRVDLCLTHEWLTKPIPEIAAVSTECSECQTAVATIEAAMVGPIGIDAVEDLLKTACMGVSTCEDLVDSYTPELLKMLEAKLEAVQICTLASMCPAGTERTMAFHPLSGASICQQCEDGVNSLKQQLQDNSDVIEQDVKNLCSLAGSQKAECEAMVEQYLPVIIRMIEADVEAKAVCAEFRFCSAAVLAKPQVAYTSYITDETCDLCKTEVDEVKKLLANNEDVEISDLDKICDLLPATYQASCEEYVKDDTPTVIELIETLADSDEICQAFQLCPAATATRSNSPQSDDVCSECEAAIAAAKSDVIAAAPALKSYLENMCEQCPEKETCKQTIDQYFEAAIELVKEEVQPLQTCQMVHMCTAESHQIRSRRLAGGDGYYGNNGYETATYNPYYGVGGDYDDDEEVGPLEKILGQVVQKAQMVMAKVQEHLMTLVQQSCEMCADVASHYNDADLGWNATDIESAMTSLQESACAKLGQASRPCKESGVVSQILELAQMNESPECPFPGPCGPGSFPDPAAIFAQITQEACGMYQNILDGIDDEDDWEDLRDDVEELGLHPLVASRVNKAVSKAQDQAPQGMKPKEVVVAQLLSDNEIAQTCNLDTSSGDGYY